MVDLISLAYDIDNSKILAGPKWLDLDRFNLSARAPSGSTPEEARLMLQTLLAERFSLKIHKDSKELPGFALSAGSGKPKMKPAADDSAAPNCQGQPQSASPDTVPQQVVDCRIFAVMSQRSSSMNLGPPCTLGLRLEAGKIPQPVIFVRQRQ